MSILKTLNVESKSKDTLIIPDDFDTHSIADNEGVVRTHRKTTHRIGKKGPPRLARLFQPSYRLESKNPFDYFVGEEIIKTIFENVLQKFRYSPKLAINTAKGLAQEIKYRLTSCNFDRYRYVCIVSIGEKLSQTFCCRMKALWDSEADSYANYVYDDPNFYAIGTILAIYYE